MAALAVPAALNATVMLSSISNIAFTSGSDLDIDGDGSSDFYLGGWDNYINASGIGLIAIDGSYNIDRLSEGEFINDGLSYDYGAPISSAGGIFYAGVEFDISGGTHYGWLKIDAGDTGALEEITILAAAWESSADTEISAGAIPEPRETVAALGLFAGLVALFRKRFRKG